MINTIEVDVPIELEAGRYVCLEDHLEFFLAAAKKFPNVTVEKFADSGEMINPDSEKPASILKGQVGIEIVGTDEEIEQLFNEADNLHRASEGLPPRQQTEASPSEQ